MLRARFEGVVRQAAQAGVPDPLRLFALTPHEMEIALNAFREERAAAMTDAEMKSALLTAAHSEGELENVGF